MGKRKESDVTPKLKGESAKTYEYFLAYRNQGVARSLTKTAQITTVSRMRLADLSRKFDWVSRCEQWDAHVHKLKEREYERVERQRAVLWERRALAAIEAGHEDALLLRQCARLMLKFPLAVQESKDGEKVIIKPGKWSLQTAADMLRLASDLQYRSIEAGRDGERCFDEMPTDTLNAVIATDGTYPVAESPSQPDLDALLAEDAQSETVNRGDELIIGQISPETGQCGPEHELGGQEGEGIMLPSD